jgi:hypothetical protein
MPLQIGIGDSTTFWNPQSPLLEDEDRAGRETGTALQTGIWCLLHYGICRLISKRRGRPGRE